MPEWLSAVLVAGALATIGWVMRQGFNGVKERLDKIDARHERYEERQSKLEKDCVGWADLEKVNLQVNGLDRRITVIETTCKAEHGK